MKAYMSTGARRPAHAYITSGHSAVCAESDEKHGLTELARILRETEPILPGYSAADCKLRGPLAWATDEAREALRDALAAVTADGGPLDQLALESQSEALDAELSDPFGLTVLCGIVGRAVAGGCSA
jgi:hypothetical protein